MSGISRDVRRCALQVLYQFDSGRSIDDDLVRSALQEGGSPEDVHARGFELARDAWSNHEQADELVRPLSPEWPTHRQPMIDRNILRLALHEILHERTPGKVAINEAVELAREYGGEKSSGFVNAILDKIWKANREDLGESTGACIEEG